jgi:hypothetical protein
MPQGGETLSRIFQSFPEVWQVAMRARLGNVEQLHGQLKNVGRTCFTRWFASVQYSRVCD